MEIISFFVNGEPVEVTVDPTTSLLEVLRNNLGLFGTKQGCDFEGECGACTVLLDGRTVRSCLTPVAKVSGRHVLTIEGLAGPGGNGKRHIKDLHPLQIAFIQSGAVQCGFCTPGMILAAKSLLDIQPDPTTEQIMDALDGNLCRCSGYAKIVAAVKLGAALLRGEQAPPSLIPEGGKPDRHAPDSARQPGHVIGGDLTRVGVIERVTGRARYVEDMAVPDLLHMQVVRSPYHHALLVRLHTEDARLVPDVVSVFTSADVPGVNHFSEYGPDEPLLAQVGVTVKSKGDPVALVVARSPEAARVGAGAVRAEFQSLSYTFDAAESLDQQAPAIHPSGNVLAVFTAARGDLETDLAGSDVLVEAHYRTASVEHAALERESTLAYLDEQGRVTVVGGTHEPHWQQQFIAPILGLDPSRVRVIVPPTGGSFGGRQDPWPLAAVALATFHLQRPVRLAYSRRESFLASTKRHAYELDYQVGATREGKLTGARVRITANTGAYSADGQYVPNHAVSACGGPYAWQSVDAKASCVYTNAPKAGQMRGFGTPQAIFALECTLDELIQALDADPIQFRLNNVLPQSAVTYLGYPVAESLGFTQVLEALRPRYDRLLQEVKTFNSRPDTYPFRKGLGVAGMWYRFGKYGVPQVKAYAELARDGHFVFYCSAPDYGQGIETVMSQLAAETLGVSRDRIELINADTALTPDSQMPGASRMTYWLGGAVCNAARNLHEEIRASAAGLLDCFPSDLVIAQEYVVSQGNPQQSIRLDEIASEWARIGKSARSLGIFDLSQMFPSKSKHRPTPHFVTGAQLAEVVVNLHTGQVLVTRVVAAHDVGRAINPRDAGGQIEGSIMMGLGAALAEEYLPDVTSGLSDYYVPTIKSMPEIEVILVEVPSFYGPLGAKGLGEAPILPTAPAIANAVSRATGVRLRELPLTAERVLRSLQTAGQMENVVRERLP